MKDKTTNCMHHRKLCYFMADAFSDIPVGIRTSVTVFKTVASSWQLVINTLILSFF